MERNTASYIKHPSFKDENGDKRYSVHYVSIARRIGAHCIGINLDIQPNVKELVHLIQYY